LPLASIWKGSISVGLVNVPVKLRSMVYDRSIHFRQLHRKCNGVIRYKRTCSKDGELVEIDEIVKGYQFHKGEFVVITPEELRSIQPESCDKIVLTKFVDYASIDPIYWDKAYVLCPDDSENAYKLLMTAMEKVDKVGIGRITLRTRERPVMVQVYQGGLVLIMLRYSDEVYNPMQFDEVVKVQNLNVDKKELDLAVKIMETYNGQFDPADFEDTFRQRVRELIDSKLKVPPMRETTESVKQVEQALVKEARKIKKGSRLTTAFK